jgi:hypothetical protein
VAVDVATSAFAGEPQPVEIYHRGIWYSGHLLGWRHDSDGRCLARVSCVVGKLKHKAWKDLADLRLPDTFADRSLALPSLETTRRIDVPEPDDDETRPHVLLADLRVRPRTPPHAITPPPARPRPAVESQKAPQPEKAAEPRPASEPLPAPAIRAAQPAIRAQDPQQAQDPCGQRPTRRPVVRPVVRTVERPRPRPTPDPRWTVTRDWLSAV